VHVRGVRGTGFLVPRISAAWQSIRAVQSVLNAGARLIMRKRKYEDITATLRDDLHWLPVRQRITYKLCTIVYTSVYTVDTRQLHLI